MAKVAVIDTGIDSSNPDLAPVLARDASNNYLGENTTGVGATTDFLTDSGWHGTHVSGLIAAKSNNGYGVTGVAGQNVQLYPIKASSDGENFDLASLVKAVQRATAYQVDIINMSLGTTTDYSQLRTAINSALAANITIVTAAGNGDDSGVGQTLSSSFQLYPAMYSTSTNGVITVGALDLVTKNISSFSNRSSTYVDILAPGANTDPQDFYKGIVSTIPLKYNIGSNASIFPSKSSTEGPGVGCLIDLKNGSAEIIQGTSMSTPIVTGALANVIAMAKSHGKTVSNSQLKAWLRGGGSPKNSGFSSYSVNGNFLNLDTLVSYAKTQINAIGTTPSPAPAPAPAPAPSPSPTPVALSIMQQPLPRQAVIGETINFAVVASSSQSISYQWYRNNIAITGATSGILTLTQVQLTQAGSYKVVVSSGGSTLTSNSVNLILALGYCN
jgi:subtilisin family serine protease